MAQDQDLSAVEVLTVLKKHFVPSWMKQDWIFPIDEKMHQKKIIEHEALLGELISWSPTVRRSTLEEALLALDEWCKHQLSAGKASWAESESYGLRSLLSLVRRDLSRTPAHMKRLIACFRDSKESQGEEEEETQL